MAALWRPRYGVRVFNLPVGFMKLSVRKQIGNYIGEFVEYDTSNTSTFWRNFMRIRVKVDVRKPLKKKKITCSGGANSIVTFQFEKLGNFCFICGLLGHTERFCDKFFTLRVEEIRREWDPSLRVVNRKSLNQDGERWLRDAEGGKVDGVVGGVLDDNRNYVGALVTIQPNGDNEKTSMDGSLDVLRREIKGKGLAVSEVVSVTNLNKSMSGVEEDNTDLELDLSEDLRDVVGWKG
ncbi:hypothetical protein PTKIN_Ptkin14bG0188200 [Pterospermum kingtungense]